MQKMLEIQNVSKTFNAGTVNEKTALNGLNLKLNEGDFVTVIGGNGAGKSTMLNAVAGVWPVDSGRIIIDGTDVTKLGEHQRAAYIGRVFQDPMTGTAATMQIEENLALAARRGKRRGLRIGITKSERERYRELLKSLDLGLEDRLTARGAQGADPLGQDRGGEPPDHHDDHPQHEGCHQVRQPPDHDARGPHHL
jgi:putative ABC transport system ATP-binding protein